MLTKVVIFNSIYVFFVIYSIMYFLFTVIIICLLVNSTTLQLWKVTLSHLGSIELRKSDIISVCYAKVSQFHLVFQNVCAGKMGQ